MDSRIDTYRHQAQVRRFIHKLQVLIAERALTHDDSKLEAPEIEHFDTVDEQLQGLTYGSSEYNAVLKQLEPALIHHYAKNAHHIDHYPDGIKGMTLVDLVEMIADWKASSLRHSDGNILKSIIVNQQRYGFSDEIKQILINTVKLFE